jgi:hypothetical protein
MVFIVGDKGEAKRLFPFNPVSITGLSMVLLLVKIDPDRPAFSVLRNSLPIAGRDAVVNEHIPNQ